MKIEKQNTKISYWLFWLFFAWVWLAKPKAKLVIPTVQPQPKHLRKKRVKVQSTASHYVKKKTSEVKKKKHVYFGLNIIIRFKFTTNFDRRAMLIVQNCLTKKFEP